ncbi:MAG: hypothetical protein KJ893_07880 [Candidatus Omnitrophica bacterium]|nr:hypothetical protein [Candidatus Omnitrophota bacterium]MBU4479045.1 hypothetical protein [Candidatus Omnitrophota bacterium]MCG2703467.1 hypothetical protein [Candidatus Omnitrophota bacterium]
MGRKHLDRCWEYMRCAEQVACAAYPDCGEVCWEAAGTMRTNEAEKRLEKQSKLARETGRDLTEQELLMFKPVRSVKLCKYIERYASCKCCPYYQYVDKIKKISKGRSPFDEW